MTRAELEEILRRDFGISSDAELLAAVDKEPGLDIGVFTKGRTERSASA